MDGQTGGWTDEKLEATEFIRRSSVHSVVPFDGLEVVVDSGRRRRTDKA